MQVLSYGKTVIVKKEAKGVLTFGADIIIEGRVEGDVARSAVRSSKRMRILAATS